MSFYCLDQVGQTFLAHIRYAGCQITEHLKRLLPFPADHKITAVKELLRGVGGFGTACKEYNLSSEDSAQVFCQIPDDIGIPDIGRESDSICSTLQNSVQNILIAVVNRKFRDLDQFRVTAGSQKGIDSGTGMYVLCVDCCQQNLHRFVFSVLCNVMDQNFHTAIVNSRVCSKAGSD